MRVKSDTAVVKPEKPSTKAEKISSLSLMLVDSAGRLEDIRRLAFEGVSCDSGVDGKQFYLSQILKLVDVEAWKGLHDKGVSP
jgi:hypothetical protein